VKQDETGWFLSRVETEIIKEALQEIINENKITDEIRQNCLATAQNYLPKKQSEKLLKKSIGGEQIN